MPSTDQYGQTIMTLDDEARYKIIQNDRDVIGGPTSLTGREFKNLLDKAHINYSIDKYYSWTYIIFKFYVEQNPEYASADQLYDAIKNLLK